MDVRVFIDLTTTVNFVTGVEAVSGEAVEVLAERPLVQPDVAGTVINVSGGDIENIPFCLIMRNAKELQYNGLHQYP